MDDRDSTVSHPPSHRSSSDLICSSPERCPPIPLSISLSTSSNNDSLTERIEECESELGPDGYGIDDHFSRLPDLCIINVFKHLERCDIKTLSLVNSRMFPFANERELDSIKWGSNNLYAYEDVNRYSFSIEGFEHEAFYDYKISTNEDGHFTETRECREYGPHRTKTLRTKTVPNSTSLMDYFFAALTELLRHRGIYDVSLSDSVACDLPYSQISITSEFFIRIITILRSHHIANFYLVPIYADNVEEGRIMLAEFVRNMDIVELYSGQNIINEYFIRTLAGGETRELNSDDPMNTDQGSEDRNPVEKLEYLFHPDRTILPCLIGYVTFQIPTLVLNHNWIADLATMCIEYYGKKSTNRIDRRAAWLKFRVDQPIRSEDIRNRINNADFKYTKRNGDHFIKRRSDRMKVIISMDGYYEVEGSIVHSILLRVFDERVDRTH